MSDSTAPSNSANSADFVDPADKHVGRQGCLSGLWFIARCVIFLLVTLWTFGAIYWDGPAQRGSGNTVIAVAWVITTCALVAAFKSPFKRALVWLTCLAVVLVPWSFVKPSNDRKWKQDWRETGWAEVYDDTVIFHNFRNFDYAPDGTITERWEKRTVRLSNLQGLDYFQDNFSGDLVAHPILSFDFGEDGYVALSIETRREEGEDFTNFGGLYKMFELQYLFGDERDFVRVRTNLRKEPVRLYRTRFDMERTRETFLACLRTFNELKERPRWYNVLTANCTTSLRAQNPAEKREKFDIRMLANGKLDEYLHEKGALVTDDLPFSELREKARINEAAEAAHSDPDFSKRIREGRPGFGEGAPPTKE